MKISGTKRYTLSSGTATSTTSGKLVDTGATFTAVYAEGWVHNTTSDTWAKITAVDGTTTLSLSDHIMASGNAYTIFRDAEHLDVPADKDFDGVGRLRTTAVLRDADGTEISSSNPLPVDAVVSIDSMNLEAEMKTNSGHDLYVVPTVSGSAGTIVFTWSDISGFTTLKQVQGVENKTQGWIYNTGDATLVSATGTTTLTLNAAAQKTGYPTFTVGDEIEVVYRNTSRLTDKAQMTKLTDGTNEVDVAVDDSAMPATPNFMPIGGEYRATATTYADGDATVLQTNENGALKVDATVDTEAPIPPYTHSSARGDFTAAYTSSTTLTITGAPTLTNNQLVYVLVTNAGGTASQLYVNGMGGTVLTVASNVITITGAGTPFASGDTYDVGVNLQDKAYDATNDVLKTSEQAPIWSKYTSPESYTTFTPVDTSYDEGDVIDVREFNTLNFYYSKTASTQDNSYIKIIYLTEVDSAVDHQELSLGSPAGGVTVLTQNVYERDKAALVEMLSLPTNGAPFMRIDIAKKTDTGTNSTFTTKINKAYI